MYRVVCSTNYVDLEARVNNLMTQGWQPQGSINQAFWLNKWGKQEQQYAQAMIEATSPTGADQDKTAPDISKYLKDNNKWYEWAKQFAIELAPLQQSNNVNTIKAVNAIIRSAKRIADDFVQGETYEDIYWKTYASGFFPNKIIVSSFDDWAKRILSKEIRITHHHQVSRMAAPGILKYLEDKYAAATKD